MKKTITAILICALVFSLCACGAASKDQTVYQEESRLYKGDAGYLTNEVYSEAADAYAMSMPAEPMAVYGMNGLALSDSAPAKEIPEQSEKLIYSADATVETTDFDKTLSLIEEMIKSCGGWIESSSVSSGDYYSISRGRNSAKTANYTLRVPGGSFDDIMDGLKLLGNVPYSSVYTENVTAQYYDTQARLDSAKTQEQSLLRLMEKAESVEDIIAIEDKLADVRYDIESLQSSLNNWDRRVSYSSIYLKVNEVAEYTPEPNIAPSFAQRMSKAMKDGLEAVGSFFTEFVLFLTEALPSLLVMALAVFLISIPVKKAVRRRKQRRNEEKSSKE